MCLLNTNPAYNKIKLAELRATDKITCWKVIAEQDGEFIPLFFGNLQFVLGENVTHPPGFHCFLTKAGAKNLRMLNERVIPVTVYGRDIMNMGQQRGYDAISATRMYIDSFEEPVDEVKKDPLVWPHERWDSSLSQCQSLD